MSVSNESQSALAIDELSNNELFEAQCDYFEKFHPSQKRASGFKRKLSTIEEESNPLTAEGEALACASGQDEVKEAAAALAPKRKVCFHSLEEKLFPEDLAWLTRQNKFNDQRNQEKTIIYPYWNVVMGKSIFLSFTFGTGEILINFKTNTQKGKDNIALDTHEFWEFISHENIIREFIASLEGKNDKTPEEALKIKQPVKEYYGWKQHSIPMTFKPNMRVVLKWKPSDKSCLVDLRMGEEQVGGRDKKFVYWKGIPDQGFCFGAGGFDYYMRFLKDKVRNGVRMWQNMHNAGEPCWKGVFTSYSKARSYIAKTKFMLAGPVEDDPLED